MSKKEQIQKLYREIQKCKGCPLWKTRTNTVAGEGNVDAEILFLGEAPGAMEDKTGRPFVGLAGKFLDELFKAAGIRREEVYITSVLKCRPVVLGALIKQQRNRPPQKLELEACKIWWQKQIGIIKPKLIALLGKIAFDTVISEGEFNEFQGKFLTKNDQQYFVTYHPAAGMRFPKIKKALEKDFKTLTKFKE